MLILNETVFVYVNNSNYDDPSKYPLPSTYTWTMPNIEDPDDTDIYMYFYKGWNETYMTLE